MGQERQHAERNRRKWDTRAETYDEKRFDYFRTLQARLIDMLPLQADLQFLDIGCGTGWAVRRVATVLDQKGEFFGIDLAPNMLEKAEMQSQHFKSVHYDIANAEALPFPANHFDLMICTNSFHHYLHPAKALSEIRRVLKLHGRLYLADVTADNIFVHALDAWTRMREPEHVRFYSTSDYHGLFGDTHLEHVASQAVMSPWKVHIAEKDQP